MNQCVIYNKGPPFLNEGYKMQTVIYTFTLGVGKADQRIQQ